MKINILKTVQYDTPQFTTLAPTPFMRQFCVGLSKKLMNTRWRRAVNILLLVGFGCVSCSSSEDKSSLLSASETGDIANVMRLIEAESDVNVRCRKGVFGTEQTPKLKREHEWGIVSFWIKNRRAYGYTPLIAASHNGHLDVVVLLVNAGADVNAVDELDEQTALSVALKRNHTNIAKYLRESGVTQ